MEVMCPVLERQESIVFCSIDKGEKKTFAIAAGGKKHFFSRNLRSITVTAHKITCGPSQPILGVEPGLAQLSPFLPLRAQPKHCPLFIILIIIQPDPSTIPTLLFPVPVRSLLPVPWRCSPSRAWPCPPPPFHPTTTAPSPPLSPPPPTRSLLQLPSLGPALPSPSAPSRRLPSLQFLTVN